MLRRILSVVRKDVVSGGRDSIVTYLVISPLVLAFGFRLLLPVLEEPHVTYAVAADAPAWVADALDSAGTVVTLPTEAAVRARVLQLDDVPGVLAGYPGVEELPRVLLQGNEAPWVQATPGIVLDAAGADVDVEIESLDAGPPRLRRILASLLAFTVLLMGGVAIGLLVLEEKESKTLRAYVISPLRFSEYLMAKIAVATSVSLVLGLASTAILLGTSLSWGALLIASIAALPAALLLGFLIAAIAEDQVAAIAILKSLLFFFTSLPVAGFFATGLWAMPLNLLTNHHAVQALYAAVAPGAAVPWGSMALSLATGLPLVALTVRLMRRKLGFAPGSAPG